MPAYRKAITLEPSYTGGLHNLSFGENTAGRYDEALKYAKCGRELTSNTVTGYYHVGVSLLQLDDDERAERFLTSGRGALSKRDAPADSHGSVEPALRTAAGRARANPRRGGEDAEHPFAYSGSARLDLFLDRNKLVCLQRV